MAGTEDWTKDTNSAYVQNRIKQHGSLAAYRASQDYLQDQAKGGNGQGGGDFFNSIGNATGLNNIGNTIHSIGNATGLNEPGKTIGSFGAGLKEQFGSGAYLTAFPALVNDMNNAQANRDAAASDEAEARERAGLSQAQLTTVRQGQITAANNMARNAGRDEQGLLGQAAASNYRTMAEKIHGAKENASSRGLLGSGFEKKAQAEARSEAAANTATQQNQIHLQTQAQVQDANDLAINLGLQIGGVQQTQADQYYQMAIQNMNQRNAALGQLGTGAGQLAGTAISSLNNPYAALSPGQLNYQSNINQAIPYQGPYGE